MTSTCEHGVRTRRRARIEDKTLRQDRWWLYPAATFVVFSALRRLRDLAGLHGQQLLRRAVPLAVLLALPDGDCVEGSSDFGQPFGWWPLSAGADHPDLPAGLPDDLLLLPQGLLPGVLAVARRPARSPSRTARYTGETPLPADPAERAPLLLVRRASWSR